MIDFNNSRSIIYGKIIHNYLEAELFGDPDIDVGDMIEYYFPKYLYREQYQKCISVFEDLYEWTVDPFWHSLTAFHEVALYHFLIEMKQLYEDIGANFKKIYYDKNIKKQIQEYAKQDLEAHYYDPDFICGELYTTPYSI